MALTIPDENVASRPIRITKDKNTLANFRSFRSLSYRDALVFCPQGTDVVASIKSQHTHGINRNPIA